MNSETKNALVEKLKSLFQERQENATLLYVALVGSRAKGFCSPSKSDFDFKVITLSTHSDYMLQKVKSSFNFATKTEDGVDVEGSAIDFLQATDYVLSNNTWVYEAFQGICLFISPLAQVLRQAWLQRAYNPFQLTKSLSGMLRCYKTKKIKTDASTTTNKIALEAVYLALKLHLLAASPSTSLPPPLDMAELMNESSAKAKIREVDIQWISDLVERRTADKSAEFPLTCEFWEFIEEALSSRERSKQTLGKEYKRDKMDCLRDHLHQEFLNSFQ